MKGLPERLPPDWIDLYEELAVPLSDLDRDHLVEPVGTDAHWHRAAQAGKQATRLRSILQVDRPVARKPAGPGPAPAVPS